MAGLFDGGGAESSIQQIQFRPQDRATIDRYLGGLQRSTSAANNTANEAGRNTLTDYAKFDPKLETNFQHAPGLDAYSQQQVSAGRQAIAQQQGARDSRIGAQFAGRNPGLAGILQSQNRFQSANAGNGLGFAAATAQQGRESNVFQNNNAARLAQSQQSSNLQQLANAGWGQKAQLGQQQLNNNVLGLGSSLAAGVAGGQKQALTLPDYQQMNAPAGRAPAVTQLGGGYYLDAQGKKRGPTGALIPQ